MQARAAQTQAKEPSVAISLERAGVCYQAPSERIITFKEYAIHWMRRVLRRDKRELRRFWALKNVDLQIQRGETFGVIGNNGAGKSTLLKLVARVLHPTTGRVFVRGHIAPLLEFGAGFHSELTGRENVYMNGALLGFTRKEMDAKFDRIVDFAELWDFIDAPLRTYSTGMHARLGFAIATDVDPDILLIDEILSVGDESFQRKSEARLETFRAHGATVLLVTHNMLAVERMCRRAAWLEHGEIKAVGETRSVIQAYRAFQS